MASLVLTCLNLIMTFMLEERLRDRAMVTQLPRGGARFKWAVPASTLGAVPDAHPVSVPEAPSSGGHLHGFPKVFQAVFAVCLCQHSIITCIYVSLVCSRRAGSMSLFTIRVSGVSHFTGTK